MSAGQGSSGRPVGGTEGGATPGTASLSLVAPKFRVPGLFWERGYLKRAGARGAGVSKRHLLCFVTPRSVDSVTGFTCSKLGGRAPCRYQTPDRSWWLREVNLLGFVVEDL